MSAIRKLEVNGWDLVLGKDDEPRVRDLDLGARLGFERPRKFRELVGRMYAAGKFKDYEVCPTVGQTSARGGRPAIEYHLTEVAALLAIAKSETPKADEITRQVCEVFVAVRHRDVKPANVVPLDVAHGPRVGETVLERAELVAWCTLAANALGVTIHRIHGAIRRTYRVPSAYAVSVFVWPLVRSFLESLAQRRLLLPGTRPRLVASNPGQLSLFQGGRA